MVVPDKNYIGAAPHMKIRQFNMGNPIKDFKYCIDLHCESAVQIRDNAMESARIAINRFLTNKLKDQYFMKIRVYPHQILRENKQAQGAGADRIQKGMSHPFGKPIGRAIRTHVGEILMSVLVDQEGIELAKQALRRAGPRLGIETSLDVHTDVKSIGTKPKEVKEITAEEIAAQEQAAKEKQAAKEGKEAPAAPTAKAAAPTAEAGKAPTGEAAKPGADAKAGATTGAAKPEAAKKEEKKK
jgi:large subunit ribosomal protein L10e